MSVLKYLLQKEFLQIFRNKAMLPIIFVLPVMQMIVLTFAADFELKNITYAFIDLDDSKESRALLQQFESSQYFQLKNKFYHYKDGMESLDENEATLLVRIPKNFSKDLQKDKTATIMLDVNSIDGQAATLSYSYAVGIISAFNKNIIAINNGREVSPPIAIDSRYWYNEEMKYKNLMVPGILALLVTMIGMFLSSMNIVKEKEIGTIEQINVSPINKLTFIIGKLLPFWVIAIIELTIGLIIGKLIFDIPFNGSLLVLYSFSAIYLLVVLGLGLWISSFADTQQQAMFLSWFLLVIFILMSGLFTPIENMPDWAQQLTKANPVAYMVKVVRSVLLKGSSFSDLKQDFLLISLYAIGMLTLAWTNYKKRA